LHPATQPGPEALHLEGRPAGNICAIQATACELARLQAAGMPVARTCLSQGIRRVNRRQEPVLAVARSMLSIRAEARTGDTQMSDLAYVLVIAAFFLLGGAYTRACERL
jgi:hypothetical protein